MQGPFYLIIHICNLFFFIEGKTVTSYAVATRPSSKGTNVLAVLTHFFPKHFFSAPWKEPQGFLMFSEGREREHRKQIG